MNKTVLALGVLGFAIGTASAESAVTVFGNIDLSGKYVKNDGSAARYSLSSDGISLSELGFRGQRDIGNGLQAGFTLSSTVQADNGTTQAKFFNRQSTISLFTPYGEVRAGRDYVPTFWNAAFFDAFGSIGIGGSYNLWQLQTTYATSPAFGNLVRADNAVSFIVTPAVGKGLYGQAMVAAGEGGTNQGRLVGGRVGYTAGPLNMAVSGAQQRFDVASNPLVTGITAGSHQNTINAGAWYDFGGYRLLGLVDHESRDRLKETRFSITGIAHFGQNEFHLGFHHSELTNGLAHNTNTDKEVAASYIYNIADRVAIYTTVGRLSNGDHPLSNVTQSVSGWNSIFSGSTEVAQPTVGGKSEGFEIGMRYGF